MFRKGIALVVMLLFVGVNINPSTGHMELSDDTTPPVTTCTLDPPEPDGDNGWYVNDVNVTLNATDDMSGVKAIYYRVVGGEWMNHTGDVLTFILDYDCLEDGLIEFYSVDYFGNQDETKSVSIDMDQLPPDIGDPVWEAFKECGNWYVTFLTNATDACSGIDRVEIFINDGLHEVITGAGPTYEFIIEWSPVFKSATFWFYCYDVAGNVASVLVNGSDIKSYSRSQSNSQQSSSTPSSQSEISVIPSTGKTDVATSRTTFNDGTLSGYVKDASMNPIEGARVRVYFHGTYEENYTDSSGYYHVTNIPICYCLKNCTASKEGYKTEWILLGIDENTIYDFVLTPFSCYPVFFGILGENDWYVSCVQIFFIWSSDVIEIWFQIDDGDWINWSEPFEPICEDGVHTICWKYEDIEGDISDVYCKDFKIDQTPPDIEEVEWETFQEPPIFGLWYCTFTCNATDNISGMDRVEMFINDGLHEVITGAGPIYEFVIELAAHFFEWVFTFVHYDTAGNFTNDSINESEINDSEITSFPYIKNNHFTFNGWLERFPILQKILEVLMLNN